MPAAITPHDARMLRLAVNSEPGTLRLLAHLRHINSGVLGLACNLKLLSAVSPKLLAEVGESEEETMHSPTADLLVDALYMIHTARVQLRVPRFTTIESIRQFHARVATEWLRAEELAKEQRKRRTRRASTVRDFPLPPVPGTGDIIPLTTSDALKKEGKQQQNCAGTYVRRVRAGSTYLYRVLRPERATLAISLGPDGCWRRSELECAANRPASKETDAAIDRWLSQHSYSA